MATSETVEILHRQYLQLVDIDHLAFPPLEMMRLPETQAKIYDSMFNREMHSIDRHYQLGVLKRIVALMENSIQDPEEDV